ncbi:MAG: hypothetical protein IT503_16720 [Burkholderiaceae bacterium]|nr:hypothetical protein [Burkholderiaceae bacterium]
MRTRWRVDPAFGSVALKRRSATGGCSSTAQPAAICLRQYEGLLAYAVAGELVTRRLVSR